MAFDWFSFLRQHNIRYTTTGPNASKGRVNIRCPFCGDADPSEHLGISIRGYGWSCWRNESHRGRTNARLVAALLHCSVKEAKRLTEGGVEVPTDNELQDSLREMLGLGMEKGAKVTSLEFPPEFKPLDNGSPFAGQFLNYLKVERHYRGTQLDWLIKTYRLHYATRGRFAYRIIIPYFDKWGELLTWTGRSILPDAELRYSSLKREEQVCSPKETLLGLPLLYRCINPRVLLVCEGPFDAFWITAFGHPLGVYATCLSGLMLSEQQTLLLLDLKERFSYIGVLLDTAASFQAFRLSTSGFDLGVEKMPDDVKDPAELSAGSVLDLCTQVLGRTS